jgi:hypothetical protein
LRGAGTEGRHHLAVVRRTAAVGGIEKILFVAVVNDRDAALSEDVSSRFVQAIGIIVQIQEAWIIVVVEEGD